jgi:MoxR-like ATPase
VVLADEINRATPRTQSALLEAMSDRQVSLDGQTHALGPPFFVLATQNPYEFEGTYPLPESQLDRFLMRIDMGYPERAAEIAMLDAHASASVIDDLEPVATGNDVAQMIAVARQVHVAPVLRGYIVDLAQATRRHPAVSLGVSPRATLALHRAGRASAASIGREYVIPDDLKALAAPVLGHRLVLNPEAEMGGITPEQVLEDVVNGVPVPSGR